MTHGLFICLLLHKEVESSCFHLDHDLFSHKALFMYKDSILYHLLMLRSV